VTHGVPLIPTAVHGTAAALPKHGLVLEQHVDARIDVLEPITPGRDPAALRDTARERIAAALAAG
jgi:1-acyl-sn-glycerol-3-phosphate acyltransferase